MDVRVGRCGSKLARIPATMSTRVQRARALARLQQDAAAAGPGGAACLPARPQKPSRARRAAEYLKAQEQKPVAKRASLHSKHRGKVLVEEKVRAQSRGAESPEVQELPSECRCCFSEEGTVQCSLGCWFCGTCVKRWAESQLFGSGRSGIKCFSTEKDSCSGTFSDVVLQLCLDAKVYKRYSERSALEAVSAALGDRLASCPRCGVGVEVGEGRKTLLCAVPGCGFLSCIGCKREAHVGETCDAFAAKESEDAETVARQRVEEAMTAAKVRSCPKCGAKFFKSEGCNKMRCRCNALMCYICRKDITKESYEHFCRTPHCSHESCGMCVLFTDSEFDDAMAVREAGRTAIAQLKGGDKDKDALMNAKIAAAAEKIDVQKLAPEAVRKRVSSRERQRIRALEERVRGAFGNGRRNANANRPGPFELHFPHVNNAQNQQHRIDRFVRVVRADQLYRGAEPAGRDAAQARAVPPARLPQAPERLLEPVLPPLPPLPPQLPLPLPPTPPPDLPPDLLELGGQELPFDVGGEGAGARAVVIPPVEEEELFLAQMYPPYDPHFEF